MHTKSESENEMKKQFTWVTSHDLYWEKQNIQALKSSIIDLA